MSVSETEFLDISSQDTKFIPQEDDDEQLWEVIEIIAEHDSTGRYKVRWAGNDPKTGRPWAPSWVAKHDCTDKLVREWKITQAKKRTKKETREAKKESKKVKGKTAISTLKSRSPTESTASASTSKRKPRAPANGPRESKASSRIGSSRTVTAEPVQPSASSSKHKESASKIAEPPPKKKRRVEEVEDGEPGIHEMKKRTKFSEDISHEKVTSTKGKEKGTEKEKGKGKERGKEKEEELARARDIFDMSEDEGAAFLGSHNPSPPPIAKTGHPRGVKRNTKAKLQADAKGSLPKSVPSKPTLNASSVPSKTISTDADADFYDEIPTHKDLEVDRSNFSPAFEESVGGGYDDIDPTGDPAPVPEPQPESYEVPSPSQRVIPTDRPPIHVEPITPLARGDESIVPETETQSSSESQSQHLLIPLVPLPIPSGNAIDDTSDIQSYAPATENSASRRPSIRSNVKKKGTTSSRVSSIVSVSPRSSKPLGKVPMVSPSAFRPHLRDDDEDEDQDYPPSSIEQFSSPLKPAGDHGREQNGRRKATVRERGAELAAAATAKRLRERGEETQRKRPLVEVLSSGELDKIASKPEPAIAQESEKGLEDVSSREVDEVSSHTEEMIAQEMEDAYVDLSGGDEGGDEVGEVHGTTQDILDAMRREEEEEEEATQDLLMSREISKEPTRDVEESDDDHVDHEDVARKDFQRKAPEVVEVEQDAQPTEPPNSAPNSPNPVQPLPLVEEDIQTQSSLPDAYELPPTASTRQNSPDTQTQDLAVSQGLDTDAITLKLLNQKSEEILKLETQLEQERARAEERAEEVNRVREALTSRITDADDVKHQLDEGKRQLTDLKEEQAIEKLAWTAERDTFITSVDTLTKAKTSLENDVAFFQDQYSQASAYVSTLQEENKELILRADIADSQVKEGLAMVKGFFEQRVKKLEVEVGKWKGLCGLLQEKDARTGDDIRRRAGEERELRLQVDRLSAQVRRQLEQIEELEGETEVWEEDGRLWRRLGKEPKPQTATDEESETGAEEPGVELEERSTQMDNLVYQCQWRPEDENVGCDGVFDSIQALEAHVSASHLSQR